MFFNFFLSLSVFLDEIRHLFRFSRFTLTRSIRLTRDVDDKFEAFHTGVYPDRLNSTGGNLSIQA